ncbi:VanW family protein [Paenibacillus beijingensis]|uniref:VanW family protein n=1 Tax=Paenibacillus beijingensis TaxID=1126833 RepID=UPI001EE76D6D|nr:VanW family protein [Paenibacillus beijingensis]
MKWLSIAGALLLLQVQLPDNLSVNHRGQTIASVNRADYKMIVFPLMDTGKFDQLTDELERNIYRSPENARLGDREEIVSEQVGYKLDRGKFEDQFFAYFFGKGSSAIEAPLKVLYPKVDSELLSDIREKPIGHYATYFNSRNKNRSHNIALAAKAVNNTVVFPGEVFSFNQVVGIRTTEKGYLRAGVIVRGELSEGVGGGICQVSSTLFNAIDRAGLKIVRRYSHSRNVPYVPPGRDATVSWGGPDFSFQNQYDQPVLIRTFAGAGKMFVTIYSSDVIEYKPREVPGMSKRLPEETTTETDLKSPRSPE